MKRFPLLLLVIIIILASCSKDSGTGYMTNAKAKYYFGLVEQVCNEDNGKLWGENLYGPIVMIDIETRKLYANAADKEGLLKEKDGIYIGTYPNEEVISFAREVGGSLFAMAPIPREEDEDEIVSTCIHGLFHCFQISKGIETDKYNTSHLSERLSRMSVKLEWKALVRAVRTSGFTRQQALRDALVFRTARREMYPNYIKEENYFENYEGLASYTYMALTSNTLEELTRKVLRQFNNIYKYRSFTHSYGFIHGNLYAYLLNEKGYEFTSVSRETDLGEEARIVYDITLPEICRDVAGSLAFNYDIDLINREENNREERLREGLRKRTVQYIERPVVLLELESPNFNFEEEDTDPVDTLGVIYQTIRVSDNWGKLAVDEGGCLLSPNLKYLRVPAKSVKTEKNHIIGEGWHIVLNTDWEMVKIDENYVIRKLVP